VRRAYLSLSRGQELHGAGRARGDHFKDSEDQIFYFRQRGLSSEDAVSMIVNGFCKQVFRELPMEFAVEAQKLLGVSLEGSVGVITDSIGDCVCREHIGDLQSAIPIGNRNRQSQIGNRQSVGG
jgi:hypothetical protein